MRGSLGISIGQQTGQVLGWGLDAFRNGLQAEAPANAAQTLINGPIVQGHRGTWTDDVTDIIHTV